ncbi:MAG: hypothetical protein FWE35_28400 [Streptosporangiales bacterium]|nr:hypothetical protein [Streptosporangiales bacterium]
MHGSGLTRALGFQRTGPDVMVSDSAQVCGFVAMRGSTEQDGQQIRLANGAILNVDRSDRPDTAALTRAFTGPRQEHWTEIRLQDSDPVDHLDLWLLTMISRGQGSGAGFSRLSATPDARKNGLADPAMRWAGAGLYENGALAWVISRPVSDDTMELGIDTRGADSSKLAETLRDLLFEWDRQRPAEPRITAARTPAKPGADPGAMRLPQPATTFAIAW